MYVIATDDSIINENAIKAITVHINKDSSVQIMAALGDSEYIPLTFCDDTEQAEKAMWAIRKALVIRDEDPIDITTIMLSIK